MPRECGDAAVNDVPENKRLKLFPGCVCAADRRKGGAPRSRDAIQESYISFKLAACDLKMSNFKLFKSADESTDRREGGASSPHEIR